MLSIVVVVESLKLRTTSATITFKSAMPYLYPKEK